MLPKIDVPTYDLKIPSSGKEIKIRPFLVKEEKMLLIAAESKDDNEIIRTTKQVINNCVVSGEVNVEKLPFFDIDYLFIALRAKSIGDTVDVKFRCNAITDEGTCGNTFDAKIDIANVEVVKDETVTKDIVLDGKTKIKMKYPSYVVMKQIAEEKIPIEKKIIVMVHSIDQIIENGKVYTSKDFTPMELKAYIESMTQEQFRKLENFIDKLPNFVITADAQCDSCGFQHKLRYDDFSSFFT